MSKSVSLYTTAAALAAADRILGPNRTWNDITPAQRVWLDDVFLPCAEVLPGISEIASNATWEIAEHVAFLKKHGWEAQVTQLDPGKFATAGVMDLGVEWQEEGKRTYVRPKRADTGYPAATVTAGVDVFRVRGHLESVARITTKSGDEVWMTQLGGTDSHDQVASLARQLFTEEIRANADSSYEGVTFPMVDLSQKRDIDDLVGLYTLSDVGQRWSVGQAVQQLTFKMNHKGARARAADEMTFESFGASADIPLVIDGPFLLAIRRPGLPHPLFATHVTEDDWKDPGEL